MARKNEKESCRARGGKMEKAEEARERKRGGRVHGEKSASRPDRRARGGGVESDPMSAAGKVSEPPFVSHKDKDRG